MSSDRRKQGANWETPNGRADFDRRIGEPERRKGERRTDTKSAFRRWEDFSKTERRQMERRADPPAAEPTLGEAARNLVESCPQATAEIRDAAYDRVLEEIAKMRIRENIIEEYSYWQGYDGALADLARRVTALKETK